MYDHFGVEGEGGGGGGGGGKNGSISGVKRVVRGPGAR